MSTQSHDSWKEQLPAYLLDALSPGEKTDLEYHLGGCAECQAELRWLEPARGRLVEQVEQIEPTPQLKSRVMAAVAADLAENPVEASAPEFEPEPEPARVREPRQRQRRNWFDFGALLRPAALGAVAAVLFAGVIVGYVVRGGSDGPGTSNDPVVAQTITGHSNVGNAGATMVTSGDSGTLKVTDLPKLEEGEVYQAWIQKGQSVYPTDSLFTPRKDGTATTSIPDLNGVSTVMVSAEPAGGSEQPTTTPIITIEIPS